jgi:hypothetical protein
LGGIGLARRRRGGLARWKTALQPAACEKGIIAMSHQVKIVSALLGCAATMLAAAASPANATVYKVNETIGLGAVVGTITTDGATGTISPSDFTAWDLQLVGLNVTTIITNNDQGAIAWGQGVDITADATHVSFNFSGNDGGFLVFQDGMGSGNTYWCVNSTNGGCLQSESVVPQHFGDPERAVCDPKRHPGHCVGRSP